MNLEKCNLIKLLKSRKSEFCSVGLLAKVSRTLVILVLYALGLTIPR